MITISHPLTSAVLIEDVATVIPRNGSSGAPVREDALSDSILNHSYWDRYGFQDNGGTNSITELMSVRWEFAFLWARYHKPMRASPAAHVNLWKKHLGRVPDSVWGEMEVEVLILAENELSEVSSEIGRLKKLRTLDLGHNRLTRVPDSLGELPDLSDFLYLQDNCLIELPSSLAQLKKLRYLNISQNRFRTMPQTICGLTSLIELRATDNEITALSDCVARLSQLRELHLRNNLLVSLPESIEMLAQLRHIDLRGNPLDYLPGSIATLPRLEKLDLRWVTTLSEPKWIRELEARGCLVYR